MRNKSLIKPIRIIHWPNQVWSNQIPGSLSERLTGVFFFSNFGTPCEQALSLYTVNSYTVEPLLSSPPLSGHISKSQSICNITINYPSIK